MKVQNFILLILFLFPLITASKEDLKIKESVEVLQVEVPVRVFYKGRPIVNLNKEDFRLYEGKKPQIINGFYIKRKKIKIQEVGFDSGKQKSSFSPRYIVLVFRILDFNEDIERGINYLFENLLHKNDQIMAFINEKTIHLDKSYWQVKKKEILKEVLKQESIKARQRLFSYFLKVKKDLEYTRNRMIEDDTYGRNTQFIIEFLNKYLSSWREYKKKYLIPDLDRYYNFSRHLEKIKMEKWVINFFQIEVFPKLKTTGQLHQKIEQMINELMVSRSEDIAYSQIISKTLDEIDKELNVANDFPVDEITKMLYKVDTTYHSVFIGTQKEALSQNLEFKRISTDIENSLREITKKTGGELVVSGNLGSALHTIGNKEDVYYVLTYTPDNPAIKKKIQVLVPDKNYNLVYDNNIRADYISEYLKKKKSQNPQIQLQSLNFKNKKLFMIINNFYVTPNKKTFIGKIKIDLKLKDTSNKTIFDQNRVIIAKKNTVTISIGFKWLKKGKYTIIAELTDLLTSKTCLDFLEIETQ